jgi:hypothetical protein
VVPGARKTPQPKRFPVWILRDGTSRGYTYVARTLPAVGDTITVTGRDDDQPHKESTEARVTRVRAGVIIAEDAGGSKV